MVIVLHGDNQVASRNRLQELKEDYEKRGKEVVFFDGKTATLEQIMLAASTNSLLGEERLVVAEGFFASKKIIRDLGLRLKGVNVIFWEGTELSKTLLSGFPKSWEIRNFPIPQVVFKFLDMLMPGKPQSALRILHTLAGDDAFSLLPLLGWHVRYLIWASTQPDSLNLPAWRKQKLVFQASRFKIEKLYSLHEQLLSLDKSLKTGTNVLPPLVSLELLVIRL